VAATKKQAPRKGRGKRRGCGVTTSRGEGLVEGIKSQGDTTTDLGEKGGPHWRKTVKRFRSNRRDRTGEETFNTWPEGFSRKTKGINPHQKRESFVGSH